MKGQLNNRFTLSSDKYNWILTDKAKGKNNQNHYFSNIKQLSNFMVDLRARECLVKCDIALCDKSSTTPPYHSVIDEIVKDLEVFIKVNTVNHAGDVK